MTHHRKNYSEYTTHLKLYIYIYIYIRTHTYTYCVCYECMCGYCCSIEKRNISPVICQLKNMKKLILRAYIYIYIYIWCQCLSILLCVCDFKLWCQDAKNWKWKNKKMKKNWCNLVSKIFRKDNVFVIKMFIIYNNNNNNNQKTKVGRKTTNKRYLPRENVDEAKKMKP